MMLRCLSPLKYIKFSLKINLLVSGNRPYGKDTQRRGLEISNRKVLMPRRKNKLEDKLYYSISEVAQR